MKGNEGVGNKLIIIMKLISTGFKVYSPPFPFHLQLLPKDKKEESDAAVVQLKHVPAEFSFKRRLEVPPVREISRREE